VTVNGWLQHAIYVAVLTALVPLLGGYMAGVYQGGGLMLERPLGWLERLVYRLIGPSARTEHNWKGGGSALDPFVFQRSHRRPDTSLATTARVSARPPGIPTREPALPLSRERDRGRLPPAVLLCMERSGLKSARDERVNEDLLSSPTPSFRCGWWESPLSNSGQPAFSASSVVA
jgi:hypothetical protein